MEFKLFIDVLLGIPIMFVAVMVYVHLLLAIARVFSGIGKFIFGLILYVCFAPIVVAPFLYLVKQNQPAVKNSTYVLIAVLFCYILILAPGFYYLGKLKIKELRRAGYFLPPK